METMFKKRISSYIPGYDNNAVIKLIIASGTIFVFFHLIRATMYVMGYSPGAFTDNWQANVALPSLAFLKYRFWTVFTYGWIHGQVSYADGGFGFWELFSNMLWLYCFGSLVQMLVGNRQVIPLFVYSTVAGGIVYLLVQLIPGHAFVAPSALMGPRAALVGFAAAAVTLAPTYRFYLTPTFSIPILVVAGFFGALMVLGSGFNLPVLLLMVAGGFTGFAYIKTLRIGYKPGEWAYTLFGNIERLATPDDRAIRNRKAGKRTIALNAVNSNIRGITQKRIDDILDKINQKGYKALTTEEKEILMHAGRDNN